MAYYFSSRIQVGCLGVITLKHNSSLENEE